MKTEYRGVSRAIFIKVRGLEFAMKEREFVCFGVCLSLCVFAIGVMVGLSI